MANESQKRNNAQPKAASPKKRKAKGRYYKPKQGPGAGAVAAICLAIFAIIAGLIAGGFYLTNRDKNNGLILDNVYVADINLGGTTKEAAKSTLESALKSKYAEPVMVVRVEGEQIQIDPTVSGFRLDLDAAVQAAYAYGRSGSEEQQQKEQMHALQNSFVVEPSVYIALNTNAIQNQLNVLGEKFSSKLSQSSCEVVGQMPSLAESAEDTKGLTLVVHLGTPEYGLDMEVLYHQVLHAYYSGTFLVEAECPAIDPAPLDLQPIFDEYFVAPVDATMDPHSFEVTEATYGYGFDLDAVQSMVDSAAFGQTLEIPFEKIQPEVLSESLSSVLFRDVLGTYTASSASDTNRDTNLALACKAIDGIVLYPGEKFSYNNALGERTEANGYKPGASYSGNETVYTIGGGICQVSSSLYYCALLADLEIVERECHAFAPAYMPIGIDATVNWGTLDFVFRNTMSYPICIEATASGGSVTVSIIGTDDRNYYVKIDSQTIRTHSYATTYEEMAADNEKGYKDGDVIVSPYTGHDVETYRCKYNKQTNELISKESEAVSNYRKRDAVICKIKSDTEETEETTAPTVIGGGNISEGGGALPPD